MKLHKIQCFWAAFTVIPRFTVLFWETKMARYIGDTVNRSTVYIISYVRLIFGRKKEGMAGETVNRGTTVLR